MTKNKLVKVQKIEIQIQNMRSECLCGEKVSASQRRQIVKKPADLSSWDIKKIIKIIAFQLRLASQESTQSDVSYNGKGCGVADRNDRGTTAESKSEERRLELL